MEHPKSPPTPLHSAARLLGWSLLLGGLALSLLAGTLAGVGTLADVLRDLGFPAGTLCIAGFLLLMLGSLTGGRHAEPPVKKDWIYEGPTKGQQKNSGVHDLRELEERLIAELERRHEDLREELHGVSELLQANLEASTLSATEWPQAAGGELATHQLEPAPRRSRPQTSITDVDGDPETEEVDFTLELEAPAPDESLLWGEAAELRESSEPEQRLTGDVAVDPSSFEWNFPIPRENPTPEDPRDPTPEAQSSAQPNPQHTAGPRPDPAAEDTPPPKEIDDWPSLDRKRIQWLDWDDDDLV